jgi:hypothetical protein
MGSCTYRSHDCGLPVELCEQSVHITREFFEQRRHTRSSPIGPAEHEDGGSLPKSESSLLMRLRAIFVVVMWG